MIVRRPNLDTAAKPRALSPGRTIGAVGEHGRRRLECSQAHLTSGCRVRFAERTHRLNVVKRFFGARIGQLVPLLKAVNAHGDRKRAPAALRPDLRIVRLNQPLQNRPRRQRRHLGQKHVAIRALLLPRKLQRRKLPVHPRHFRTNGAGVPSRAVDQRFLRFRI